MTRKNHPYADYLT